MALGDGFTMPALDSPQGQALLSAAFSLMGARGNSMGEAIGSAGRDYMATYGTARNAQEAAALRKLQMEKAQLELSQVKAAQEAQARKLNALPGLFVGGQDATPAFNPLADSPFVPTPARPAVAPTLDWRKGLSAGYTTAELKDLAEMQNLGKSKIKQIETVNIEGKPVKIGIDEFGQKVAQIGMEWKPLERQDFGGFIGGIDPTDPTKPVVNYGNKTMSAAEIASNRVAQGNLALSRERLNFDKAGGADAAKPQLSMEAGGWFYRPDAANPSGRVVKVDGLNPKATEGERTAGALLQRLVTSQQQLNTALKDDAGAAKPGVVSTLMRGVGADTAANVVTGENRQRVEAAQLDILDAALTLGTGAAYTKEQLEGYRKSYFPQIGDSQKTIEEKNARLESVINSAKIKAGPAAANVIRNSGGATGGWEGGASAASPNFVFRNGKLVPVN